MPTLKWSDWLPLTANALASASLPRKGVYVVRSRNRAVGRVVGASSILYIGIPRWRGAGSIGKRLKQAITPKAPHPLQPRLQEFLGLGEPVDFCCAKTSTPELMESALLAFFEKAHLELPPFNRQGGNRK
ncbi:MAG: hypothetical protein HYX59_14150 [Elusimicrobia bacterium]|nr:hypothetical protein [Elusimicrobiota bacterium]